MFRFPKPSTLTMGPTQPPFNVHRDCFPWVKRPGRHDDHSPPFSAEVKNEWSFTSTPPYTFMAWVGTDLRFLPTLIIRCFNFLKIIIRFFITRKLGLRVRIIFVWIYVNLIEEVLRLLCRPSEDVFCVGNVYRRSGVEQSDCSYTSGLRRPSSRHLNPASRKEHKCSVSVIYTFRHVL
jgi:hypothetical protein